MSCLGTRLNLTSHHVAFNKVGRGQSHSTLQNEVVYHGFDVPWLLGVPCPLHLHGILRLSGTERLPVGAQTAHLFDK